MKNLDRQGSGPPRSAHSPRWWKRIAFSLIPTIAFWILLESALAVVGVEPLTRRGDPLVGFSGLETLYVEEAEPGQPVSMVTRRTKLEWFNFQSFPKAKPEGTRRIFCLGGSTTYGRPYFDDASFAGWMREMLGELAHDSDNPQEWEVINAGGVSYASYRVAAIMEELLEYEPDVFVIYSAHNEFLERRTYDAMFRRPPWLIRIQGFLARTRTFALIQRLRHGGRDPSHQPERDNQPGMDAEQAEAAASRNPRGRRRPGGKRQIELLPREVDERLNHTVGPTDYQRDDAWSRRVVKHYEMNLMRMVDMARSVGAQVVLVRPAVNLRDLSPFKSQFSDATPESSRQEVQDLLVQARSAAEAGEWNDALRFSQQAVQFDVHCADAQYCFGQALFELGRFEEAQLALQRAVDEDVCPLRATEDIEAAVDQVVQKTGVACFDLGADLKQACLEKYGHQVLGREYFLDHVHPTIRANGRLATGILHEMSKLNLISAESDQIVAAEKRAAKVVEARIDKETQGIALRNLAKVLHWSGKFAEALPRADDAIELLGYDPESRLIMADCLCQLGFTDRALAQYDILFADSPGYELAFLPYGTLLYDLGDYEEARYHLLMACVAAPESGYVLWMLSRVQLALGETQEAAETLRAAKKLSPEDERIEAALQAVNPGL